MPRYFFHLSKNGSEELDVEGTDLAGWQEAHVEAVRYAGMNIASMASSIKLDEDWMMRVTDERGLIVIVLSFNVSGTAALPYHS